MTRDEGIKKLGGMIKDIKFAMLTTVCPDGTLRSRPMATQETEFDGELWFFTYANSEKVQEVEDEEHVNVSYADPASNAYVSVSGRAFITLDREKAKQLWRPVLRAWFPKGLDDPNLALMRIEVDQAEYWDGPSSKMVQLVTYVKTVATGKRADPPGKNEKVKL